MFGVHKFHSYLYGWKFRIYTNHKPLLGILQLNKPIPTMAPPGIHRYALYLSRYEYELEYHKGLSNGNANCQSRLSESAEVQNVSIPGDSMFVMDHLGNIRAVKVKGIDRWTSQDPILNAVRHQVLSGWPNKDSQVGLKPLIQWKKLVTKVRQDSLEWSHETLQSHKYTGIPYITVHILTLLSACNHSQFWASLKLPLTRINMN